jgi:hypothetical protein
MISHRHFDSFHRLIFLPLQVGAGSRESEALNSLPGLRDKSSVFKVAKSRNLDSAPDPREYPFFLRMSGLKND